MGDWAVHMGTEHRAQCARYKDGISEPHSPVVCRPLAHLTSFAKEKFLPLCLCVSAFLKCALKYFG